MQNKELSIKRKKPNKQYKTCVKFLRTVRSIVLVRFCHVLGWDFSVIFPNKNRMVESDLSISDQGSHELNLNFVQTKINNIVTVKPPQFGV